MSEKLTLAIEAIKAGNKQLGQQLLAQVLQSDPNNEQAWLWMSAAVDEDKRKYCIERVLKINPNNTLASQALKQLNNKQLLKPQNEHPTSLQKAEAFSQENKEQHDLIEAQKPSIARVVIKDSLKIGLMGGILGTVISLVVSLVIQYETVTWLGMAIIVSACISSNITSGVIFFRRRIGANFSVSFGGFVNGFITGAILSLVYGAIIIRPPSGDLTLYVIFYLALCGLILPFFSAVIGSVLIWIPRIFINPSSAENNENSIHNGQNSLEVPRTAFVHPSIKQERPVTHLTENRHIDNPIVKKEPAKSIDNPRLWISATKTRVFVFSLTENELYIKSAPRGSLQKIRDSIMKGESPEQFLTDKINIPYKNITKIRQILSTIRIFYTSESQEISQVLDCEDAKMADEIVNLLRKYLPSQFDETNKPIGAGTSLFVSGMVMLIVFTATAFFYYGAYELENGIISPRGSARTRAILNLLELLGTNGVLIIGGILFLLSLGFMIYLIKSPPTVIELIRKSSQKIEDAPNYYSQKQTPLTSTSPSKPEQLITPTLEATTGAIFIDGLLAGLILGVIGAILPGIAIFTGNKQLAQFGMYLDAFLMLFSGVLTGILFQERNIGKSRFIIPGGAIAGALTGLLTGIVLGLSPQNSIITNIATQDGFKIYMISCVVNPSIGGAILGAFSAWMFGLTSKNNNSLESKSTSTQKAEVKQQSLPSIQNDSIENRFIEMFKRRIVFFVVGIGIIFICTLCQSLVNSL